MGAQIINPNGANPTQPVTGTGAAGTADTGVLTVQGIASMTPLLVTPAANSAVNVAQINGVTPLMGSGNTGTGSVRVTVATDQPKFSVTSNYPEKAFYGTTTTTVISTATDIAANAFSGAPAATFDNTTDATVPYARWAKAVAVFPDWAAAPVAGTTVDLYGLLIDVDSTSDDTQAPSGSAQGGARYFGSFYISADDALQRRTITIDLLGVEKVDFYIINRTAQNMNNDAGTSCTVKITPLSYGVVA